MVPLSVRWRNLINEPKGAHNFVQAAYFCLEDQASVDRPPFADDDRGRIVVLGAGEERGQNVAPRYTICTEITTKHGTAYWSLREGGGVDLSK